MSDSENAAKPPRKPPVIPHPSVDERHARGREARKRVPRSSHADWSPAPDRRDPVTLLEEQNARREPDLVPVRHGRMMVSPFTFYRGAARVMAADLSATPVSGINAQICGDAHLSNFGLFGSPERELLFDLNDFDETLPGPWEWDVKRMAASFTIAGRYRGFTPKEIVAATAKSVSSYREAMEGFAGMRMLDVWYAHLRADDLLAQAQAIASKRQMKTATKTMDKARMHDSVQALGKLAVEVDGEFRIASAPPIVVPLRDLQIAAGIDPETLNDVIHEQFRGYRMTLQPDRRTLLERYKVVDAARKVVGVGSVGTRAFIALLEGRDRDDPLFLQLKEATDSVLEEFLPKSRYRHHGERVVQGQRAMQAASDIFLGWTKGVDTTRHFYWRQLRDMKGSLDAEVVDPLALVFYAGACGWTLARAHARTGDAVSIAAYLGKSDSFDRAIVEFSERYARQNEEDHGAFIAAIGSGRLEAIEGV
jgi:uncharacterized protein (DUF2252 family)